MILQAVNELGGSDFLARLLDQHGVAFGRGHLSAVVLLLVHGAIALAAMNMARSSTVAARADNMRVGHHRNRPYKDAPLALAIRADHSGVPISAEDT